MRGCMRTPIVRRAAGLALFLLGALAGPARGLSQCAFSGDTAIAGEPCACDLSAAVLVADCAVGKFCYETPRMCYAAARVYESDIPAETNQNFPCAVATTCGLLWVECNTAQTEYHTDYSITTRPSAGADSAAVVAEVDGKVARGWSCQAHCSVASEPSFAARS